MTIACEKAFALKVNPQVSADLLSWWTMEAAVSPWLDSVDGRPLIDAPLDPQVSVAGGKVNRALRFQTAPGAPQNAMSDHSITPAASSGSISFTAWINRSFITGPVGSDSVLDIQVVNGILIPFGRIELRTSPTSTRLRLFDGLFVVQLTLIQAGITNGAWHFFCGHYDHSTGRIGLRVDNNLRQETLGSFILPDVYSFYNLDLTFSGAIPGPLDQCLYDEVTVWDGVLTDSQINNLWNGGAGKTYPP